MSCTTILVGKKASYDGSTMIARNDDSGAGSFTPKHFTVIHPDPAKTVYRSVLSHVEIPLPKKAQRITAVPNVIPGKGIWAACGVNEKNVAMTATETIAVNDRVLGADPFVTYEKAAGRRPEKKGGIGEEDIVYLVLPYISSAREGVLRLGELLEKYGTYEANGIAFSDKDEIWWVETIGGHHFIAKRVPDNMVVVMPNQLGLDSFDFADALGKQKNHICSGDMKSFTGENHLDLSFDGDLNPRDAYGTHDDADHVYNTPRAWYMLRYLLPSEKWDGPDARYTTMSDDMPWAVVPERKITPYDVKYLLSSHFQGTPYDPYLSYGDTSMKGAYRSIGINRTDFMGLLQIRPYVKAEIAAVEWLAFASNAFNVMAPFYTCIDDTPSYLKNTKKDVSTDSFYWASRLIAALSDADYAGSINHIERYREKSDAKNNELLKKHDAVLSKTAKKDISKAAGEANRETAAELKKNTDEVLRRVLDSASNSMKNQYKRSDN